jgi:hypothetical protein
MPEQEIQMANPAGHSTILPAAEVVAIVREWVHLHARNLPDFAGAYLWGGITALPPDAPFHLYRDVDVVVVLTHGAPDEEEEFFYRGLILEDIWKNLEAHRDAEAVLADASDGPNIATTQILSDPTGILTPLHHAVAAGYHILSQGIVQNNLGTRRKTSVSGSRKSAVVAMAIRTVNSDAIIPAIGPPTMISPNEFTCPTIESSVARMRGSTC